VRSSSYGETDGCGAYHAASLDLEVTVQTSSIAEPDQLEALAIRIDQIVQQIYQQAKAAPNLGRRQVVFVASNGTCRWDAEQRACQQL
jgi:hypothetical protein